MRQPELLDEHSLTQSDFDVEEFHQIVFASIYNLHNSGVQVIDAYAIDSFLVPYQRQKKVFEANKGIEYVNDCMELCEPANFLYNLNRIKKFSYLRFLQRRGLDITFLYDTSLTTILEQEAEAAKFDKYTIDEMIDLVEIKLVTDAKIQFISESSNKGQLAGEGMDNLIESFKFAPDIGYPMQSKFMNTLLRGSRRKTFYLRSGSTGSGKSRMSFADTCCASVPWIYNLSSGSWEYTGFEIPSLIISTELSISEVQTILLAYVSGVEEDHILDYNYAPGEEKRVKQASEYINAAPLWIEELLDFNLDDIKNLIKKYRREKGVGLVNFDYLHLSIKLMTQMAKIANGARLREDQMLFMASDMLKNDSVKMNIHIDSGTQLSGEWEKAQYKDQNILRGSKAMADRVDGGYIMMPPSKAELDSVKPILARMINAPTPNMIYHLYKARKGKIARVKVFTYVNLSNCRLVDLFVTDFNNEMIPVEQLTIENVDAVLNEHSIDPQDLPDDEDEEMTEPLSFWDCKVRF